MTEQLENRRLVKMEVLVHSTLSTIGGQVTVSTDPNQTIDTLITSFCVEKNIQHRRDYVLRNREQEVLNNTHTLSAARVFNGDILFLAIREGGDSGTWLFGCSPWWLLAGVALLIGTMGITAISIIKVDGTVQPNAYGVVLDAGSSHTQLFVYRWPADKLDGTGIVNQELSCRTNGSGISHYTANPSAAGASLEECLSQAADKVPQSDHAATQLFLGATAGMRLLRDSDNASESDFAAEILRSVRASLAASPFNFSQPLTQARILHGQEEGAFGWVTVNYLNATFGDFRSRHLFLAPLAPPAAIPLSLGALDLGGASTQITFIPAAAAHETPAVYLQELQLFGEQYSVYTHSYLCFGLNEAYRQYLAHLVTSQTFSVNVRNPCGAKGNTTAYPFEEIFELPCTLDKPSNDSHKNTTYLFEGSSDSEQCAAAVRTIFDFDAACPDPPCTFAGVHQPAVSGEYMAFSGFYYTMAFLNLTAANQPSSLAHFQAAMTEYCSRNWTEVSKEDVSPELLLKYCFEAHYIHTLLVDAYKFNAATWPSISFTNTVPIVGGDVDVGWSLGFMLNTSNLSPVQGPVDSISVTLFVLLFLLFMLFVALAGGFGWYARANTDGTVRRRYQKMSSYGAV